MHGIGDNNNRLIKLIHWLVCLSFLTRPIPHHCHLDAAGAEQKAKHFRDLTQPTIDTGF
jgi:hypothetical protein